MCGCLGGPGPVCSELPETAAAGALGALAREAVDEHTKFVCIGFAETDGIAITDHSAHGYCEMYMLR